MRLIERLEERLALVDLAQQTKEGVLAEMLDAICTVKGIQKELRNDILSGLLKRESLGSTGIGNGFSIPHTKVEGLSDFFICIGRSSGVEFNAVDNAPVRIVFMLISPKGNDTIHLEFLKRVATLGRNSDFVKFLGQANNPKEVLDLVEEMDA